MAKRQASTKDRGYSGRHVAIRASYQRRMDTGEQFTCSKPGCGRLINPTAWDLAHHPIDRSVYLGPQCVGCNRDTRLEKLIKATGGRTVALRPRRWTL